MLSARRGLCLGDRRGRILVVAISEERGFSILHFIIELLGLFLQVDDEGKQHQHIEHGGDRVREANAMSGQCSPGGLQ